MSRLDGKVALITGSARGIGEAIAQAFIATGARVVVTDINSDLGQQVAQQLGSKATFHFLDVRVENDWVTAMEFVMKKHGHLDILVNNAGITGFEFGAVPQDPENITLEVWRAVHKTNLDGVFLGCKYGIRTMRITGYGSIINISSRSGVVGVPAAAAYASSKAAIRNHTKTVALYCAEQGLNIRCNSIHPANILTPMWDPVLGTGIGRQERIKHFARDIPLHRFGTPEEVASVAILLASDEATYMTGAEFNIDGGILAGSLGQPRIKE